MKIFGEEHFIDNTMIVAKIQNKFQEKIEECLVGDVFKMTMEVGFEIDKDKLKKWIELCGKLEHIDKSDLIDMATKKKFEEKDQKIEKLKENLRYAYDDFNEIQQENDKLSQELEDYKEAYRELCYYVEYEYPKKNDDIYYRKAQELEMIFLNKVRENRKGENK